MSQEALEMFSLRELKEIQRVATTTKTKHQFLQLLDQKIAEIEQKTYNDMIVKNARIEASGGNSQFIAVVENPYDKPIESEEVEVVFINEDGSEIARIETTFPELEPNGTSELGASTDIDITTAYDFYISLKK